jgi:hypothetical protein
MSFSRIPGALSLLFASSLLAQGLAIPDEAVRNWTASPYWWGAAGDGKNVSEALAESGDPALEPMGALPSAPLPLTAVTPCRIVDTRLANGAFGGPALVANATRTFNLPSGPCAGLPADAAAWSLNFTIIGGAGTFQNAFLTAWATGDSQPVASTLNFNANQLESNAAIVPAGTSGSINVFVNAPGHLLIDVNGYYKAISIVNSVNGQSGVVTMAALPPGSANSTLRHNGTNWVTNIGLTSDGSNVSVNGVLRLSPGEVLMTRGFLGNRFLSTISGSLILGDLAGGASMTGPYNTALGTGALFSDTSGAWNTAIGHQSLNVNMGGDNNTALGFRALASSSSSDNTAIGSSALSNTTGGGNVALGKDSGINLTSGDFNMYLGNPGVVSESNTIRLGAGGGVHTKLFLAGVLGTSIGSASPMYINSVAQVGTVVSSLRYKEDIRSMGDASKRIFQLRPVTFRYKDHPDDPMQFGLIAEDVERVLPELVTHNAEGDPESVMYHELPAMLINEIQKQENRIERQEEEIRELRALVEALSAGQLRPECSGR